MRPPDCQIPDDSDPLWQVVQQIRDIEEHIRITAQGAGIRRLIEVQYEQLCRDTTGTLNQLADRLRSFGMTLADRTQAIPTELPCGNQQKLSNQRWQSLLRYVGDRQVEPIPTGSSPASESQRLRAISRAVTG